MKYENLVFVDCEATGPSPFSGVLTEFGAVHYVSRETFHGVLHDSQPSRMNPAVPVLTAGGETYSKPVVMGGFEHWLAITVPTSAGHPVMVSDNPAFDFMWIAYAFDGVGLINPFGHSARRIGDFYAGLEADWTKTQRWKNFRVTKHDHNPVHDAMGNVEAFAKIMDMLEAAQATAAVFASGGPS